MEKSDLTFFTLFSKATEPGRWKRMSWSRDKTRFFWGGVVKVKVFSEKRSIYKLYMTRKLSFCVFLDSYV